MSGTHTPIKCKSPDEYSPKSCITSTVHVAPRYHLDTISTLRITQCFLAVFLGTAKGFADVSMLCSDPSLDVESVAQRKALVLGLTS